MKMNNIIIAFILFLTISSCAPKRVIEEQEKIVYVDRLVRDSIVVEKESIVYDSFYTEVEVDCNDLKPSSTKVGDSKSKLDVKKDSTGKVVIRYIRGPIEQKIEKVYIEKESTKDSVVSDKKTSIKETVIEQTFWQKIKNNFYQYGFYLVLVLWIIGLTPMKLIRKIIV